MNFFVLERIVEFSASSPSLNQCKVVKHPKYTAHIKIAFHEDQSLDDDGWVIDHTDIFKAVTEAKISGSCEEMQYKIADLVQQACEIHGCPMVAYKCAIYPEDKPKAFINYCWADESRLSHAEMVLYLLAIK